MLKHRETARTDDAETQGSRPVSGQHSQSTIHVVETARELRC
jgi:hypothetical protein